jgi:hypothetical protein
MWITLYDVSRDGMGILPSLLTLFWVAGIIGAAIALKKSPSGRPFLYFWMAFWLVAGSFGLGYGVFYNYAVNVHALKADTCAIIEGPIENFHPQNIMRKGDSEHFVVEGHEFRYAYDTLGGGGLRSSKNFRTPLREGLYVKIWYRGGIICRIDAAPRLSSALTP